MQGEVLRERSPGRGRIARLCRAVAPLALAGLGAGVLAASCASRARSRRARRAGGPVGPAAAGPKAPAPSPGEAVGEPEAGLPGPARPLPEPPPPEVSVAAEHGATPGSLLLSAWEPERWALADDMKLERGVGTTPEGDPLARVTLRRGEGQAALTLVNLPATAGEFSCSMRDTGSGPARHEALFQDANGWTGAGNTLWGLKQDSVYRTNALAHGWSWRVGFFKAKTEAPFRFRGWRLSGGDREGDVTWEVGPVRVAYEPSDEGWFYADVQPKIVAVADGAVPPVTLRVANLGETARVFKVSAQPVRRNLEKTTGAIAFTTPELALEPGGMVELAVKNPPLRLLGRYEIELRAESEGAKAATARDDIAVVNALDGAEGFRRWAGRRGWFSMPDRRPAAGSDGKAEIRVASASNGVSPVPVFPLNRRVALGDASVAGALGGDAAKTGQLTVVSTCLSPAWLVRSADREMALLGGTTRSGLAGPSHVAFAAGGATRVLKVGDSLGAAELAAMSEPWLLAWWQGSEGWADWDAPHLVTLQHRPASLALKGDGISVAFEREAGWLAVMPLYGYAKPPQRAAWERDPGRFRLPGSWPEEAKRTWLWEARLPEWVAARCSWWSRALGRVPCGVRETFRLNHEAGSVDVRDEFEYLDIANDWGTEAITLAPLSPTLALAARGGYPLEVEGDLVDPEYPTMLGPYSALAGARAISYGMKIGPFLLETADPDVSAPQDASTPARRAQAELLAGARARASDAEDQMWGYQDGNFVWYMQGKDMRDPAIQTAYVKGGLRRDQKAWLQARALHTLLDARRYGMDERGGTMTRRYIDGPGIGNWGSHEWGDSGKLGTDMIYDAYCYAYNTGDWQTVADRWDLVASLNTLPVTMTWATAGRAAIAEMGDEAPPMLALARMAYAVGDREVYAAASYWYALELAHHAVKDGAMTGWLDDKKPWHRGMDLPTEAPTNLWGTNANWVGGGWRTGAAGENQWVNFYVRFDDLDVLGFHRRHATGLPRRVDASATPEESKGSFPLYFIRVGILGQDPARAQRLYGGTPDKLVARRMTAMHEFEGERERLIPVNAPDFRDEGWAWDQMHEHSCGLVNPAGVPKAGLPALRWFWWSSPRKIPGVDWGDKWTFGSLAPAGLVPEEVVETRLGAATRLFSYELREPTLTDRFPASLREAAAKSGLAERDLAAAADAWDAQQSVPVIACGPFVNPGGGPNTKVAHAPEAAYLAGKLAPSDSYEDSAAEPDPKKGNAWKPAGPVRWREASLDGAYLDFLDLWPPSREREDVAGYVALWVRPPRAMPVTLAIGSDDGVKVWVNGKAVHDNPASRGAAPDQDRAAARLEAGWNSVLVKVTQGGGGWGLFLRVAGPEGLPVPGLEFSREPPK